MVKVAVAITFLVSCLLGRLVGLAIMFAIEGIKFDILATFNGWTVYVVATTGLVAYSLSFLWAKGRHLLATATITAVVATLVFLPSTHMNVGANDLLSLLYVFLEWFVIGVAAHFACIGVLHQSTKRRVPDVNYW